VPEKYSAFLAAVALPLAEGKIVMTFVCSTAGSDCYNEVLWSIFFEKVAGAEFLV
jgi:hypothetical protein